MKQSTLAFASAKRAAPANTVAKPKVSSQPSREVASTTTPENDRKHYNFDLDSNKKDLKWEDASVATSHPYQYQEDKDVETLSAGRETRSATKKAKALNTISKKAVEVPKQLSTDATKANGAINPLNGEAEDTKKVEAIAPKEDAQELPELNVKDPKYRQHYAEVKEKMGGLPAIHGEKQNKIHDILRVFDNSSEYGPCVGISRRDRWDRAQALGLKPPKEINDILNTKQGTNLTEYSQSVFYGEV